MNAVPLNIDFQQILLHLLNVAILFLILYFLIYKPVKNFMDKRRQEYQDMDDAANSKLSEADQLKERYEAKLKQAEEEIREMKSEASKAIETRSTESMNEAKAQAEDILTQAKVQAENEKEKILKQTGDQVADLAREAASRVVFHNSSEAFDSFLNAAKGQKQNG